MNIILAPHIDDEVIGCYSILNNVDEVYYFFDIDDIRKQEAINTAKLFNFTPYFSSTIYVNNNDTVYVPSSSDLHKDHLYVNRLAKKLQQVFNFELKYYSIDMNKTPTYLGELSRLKKKHLYSLFPSQSNLFDSDEKYFLFEDISDIDYTDNTFMELIYYNSYIKITIENTQIWDNLLHNLSDNWYNQPPETVLNKIQSNILKELNIKSKKTKVLLDIKTTNNIIREYQL